MDIRGFIFVILRAALGLLIWGGIAHSIFVGVRYGFRFPRILHFMAIAIMILETVVLALFPVPLAGVTMLLASLWVLFPLSSYIGWVLVGGPTTTQSRPRNHFTPRPDPFRTGAKPR